ncbi:hypothetical protein ACFWBV_22740 [Streptomyces sp. NPDC060030]|uniref:hypothetical protein n=1 Tax=Streptomyces sp. NPDC060030 TaxID=3347042 RepID=UPI00369A2B68
MAEGAAVALRLRLRAELGAERYAKESAQGCGLTPRDVLGLLDGVAREFSGS